MSIRTHKADPISRFFVLLTTVFAVGILVTGCLKLLAICLRPSEIRQESAVLQSIVDSGRALVGDIERVVQPAMRRGRMLAASSELVEAIRGANRELLTELCNKAIMNATEVDAIALFDAKGSIVAINSRYSDGKAIPEDRVQRIMQSDFTGREIITRCVNNESRSEVLEFQTTCDITPAFFDSIGLSVAHSVPIYDNDGIQIGLVSTRLRFERISSLIANRTIANGRGSVYFVTDAGAFFDESRNAGAVAPIPVKDLASIIGPLVAGKASQFMVERYDNLHAFFRLSNLQTLGGGGIQAMITVPKAWTYRESRLEDLLTIGGTISLGILSLAIVGVLSLLQETRSQKELSQRLAVIAQRTSNGVICCDDKRRVVWVNDSFVRMTGYELGDVAGRSIGSLLYCDRTNSLAIDRLQKAIDDGVNIRTEILNCRKDGHAYWSDVEFQPIHDSVGNVREYVSIVRDISEQTTEKMRLQSVFAAVAEGIVLQTAAGEIVECNAAAERILGLTTDQILGRTSLDPRWLAIREDGRALPGTEHPAMVTARTGQPQRDFVFGVRTPEEVTRWISVNTEPILDSVGNVALVVSSFADITQFREQSQRLQVIIDASKIGTWDWDIQTGHVAFDEHWTQMLGYELSEIAPHITSWEKILDPAYVQSTWAVVQKHLVGESAEYRNEIRMRRKDGSYAWVLAAGKIISRLADGTPKRMVGIHLDVTESKYAETQLQELTERYAAAISGTSDGLWDWNCGSEECWYSDRFWTLLGFPENGPFPAANLQSFNDRVHPDDGPSTWEAVRRNQEEGIEFDHEYRMLHQNGEYRWFRGRAATQFDENRQPIRMAGSIQDIHDLKSTQNSLVNANVRAEAASAAKSEFLANMSHEIRTPMTAILGFADLLLHEIESEIGKPSCLDYVSTIRRNGEHLLEIINDILDMSKIEACKMTVEKVPTHPEGLICDIISLMSVKALAKGLHIEAILDPAVPSTIQTDPVRLRQILVNLIGNAIKFTELGSVKVRVTCSVPEQLLHLAIEDTGIGMSSEQISRIFGAFEQADTTTTRKYGGSGLGLYICNRLVEMLGGTIRIESRLGVGSTFTATIATGPISEAALVTCSLTSKFYEVTSSLKANALDETRPLNGIRILLAEDGPDNQRLISHVLRKAGADVQIAENGRLAIELLTTDGTLESTLIEPCPFDLLLSDMQMPEMDGYATVRWLRAHGSRMPIVALTAHAMSEELQQCIEAGCDACATKPINKSNLIDLCQQWAFGSRENVACEA